LVFEARYYLFLGMLPFVLPILFIGFPREGYSKRNCLSHQKFNISK